MNPSFAMPSPSSTPFNFAGMRGNFVQRTQTSGSNAAPSFRSQQLPPQPVSRPQISNHLAAFNNMNSGGSASSSGGVAVATQLQPPQQQIVQNADPLQGAKKSVEDYYKRQAASDAELQSFVRSVT